MSIRETEYIWMDGEFVEWDKATVHVLTHALHYGTAVFEGIRGYASDGNLYVFRLDDHLKRLKNSAKVYMMDFDYSIEDLHEATVQLLRKNEIHEFSYIRPIAYRGYNKMIGLNPLNIPVRVSIITVPFGKYLDTSKGINCCFTSWRRIAPDALPPEAKASGNYINSVLAKIEAVKNGYDEAIFLDSHGFVSEGSGENIFIVRDGVLYTPPVSASILIGITRESVIELARDLGYEVVERSITKAELYICDEAFFTGTAAEITPIGRVDQRHIGTGDVGPVTRKLQEAFFRIVEGKNPKYGRWLTPVY